MRLPDAAAAAELEALAGASFLAFWARVAPFDCSAIVGSLDAERDGEREGEGETGEGES
jgi:hypothetical protein